MTEHGITWDMVRRGTTDEIVAGTTWVVPGVGTAYREASDGNVRGCGWLPLDGTVWTATAVVGGVVTARSHDGREVAEPLPPGRGVLIRK